ncbi:MAG TPA: hypothetical protein VM864_13640 [Pyrinomonadaceae bacterium]|jgi:hypothetical protein|nr:hypothetical protein [Pyrinomonadaceae bacterium]
MSFFRAQPLYNDSYQYLNVAENFTRGPGPDTSLVHFDTERSHRRIPAPLTSFPPGYPALVAITSARFGDLERVARVVSVVSHAGTAALLAWALILLNVPAFSRRVLLLLFITNAVALGYATAVMTEPLFMLLSTCAVVALIWSEKGQPPSHVLIARAVIAYAFAGLSCWVRYAGFFFIAGVVAYALLRWLRERSRRRRILLFAALIPVASACSLMLRNLLSVGTWKGGNEMPVRNPLDSVAAEYVRGHLHLFFGEHPHTIGGWEGLTLVGGLGIAAILISSFKGGGPNTGGRRMAFRGSPDGAVLAVALCVLLYSAGMFYAGLTTVISFGTRMFLPALPHYLLLLGTFMSRPISPLPPGARGRWLKAALLAVIVGYVGSNAREVSERPPPARHELLATQFAEPTAGGRPLREWVESNIPAGDVIMAADGQATGHLLRRPTVSMVEAQYSRVRWECDEVKKQFKTYGVKYLILYKPSAAITQDPLMAESEFVAAAVSRTPPCGFTVAAENPYVRILVEGGTQ